MKNAAMQRKKILWLVSWYPNNEDHYSGDFIQRHARAAALVNDIHVLYVTDANSIRVPVINDIKKQGALTEQIIYFKKSKGVLYKLSKQKVWFYLYKKAIRIYIKQNGLPYVVHVHVAWKSGLLALWLKRKYKLPFVITEHWGIYNNVVNDSFFQKPFVVQYLIKKIFRESIQLASVSLYLAKSIRAWIPNHSVTVVHNVVDTKLFFPKNEKHKLFTFIHVSNIVPLKNVKGILKAFKLCNQHHYFDQMQLIIIGTKDNTYHQLTKELGLERYVILKGEIPYSEVAIEMQKAHCFILNSFIENAPCVIGEAHCCGIPVIATNVGGIPELVNGINGILVEPNNDEALSKGILHVFKNYQAFNLNEIASTAATKYSYLQASNHFNAIYEGSRNV